MDETQMTSDLSLIGCDSPLDDAQCAISIKEEKAGVDNPEGKEIQQCRLCANYGTGQIPIFAENNSAVAEKISRCLPIIVLSTDELPLHVCTQCFYFLNISYRLIVGSLKADGQLRAKLAESSKSSGPNRRDNALSHLDENVIKEEGSEVFERSTEGPAKCDLCNKEFEDMDVFDNHMEKVHLLKWRCNLCDKSFQLSVELVMHKESSHPGEVVTCTDCDCTEQSCDESLVEEATETIDDEVTPFSPSISNRTTDNAIKKKIIENPVLCSPLEVTCDICQITVDDDELLAKHKNIHLPSTNNCVTCQAAFPSVYDLFVHKREAHNMYKKVQLKFICDLCGKFFTNSTQWEFHLEETCPKKFSVHKCKYCASIFSTNHKLTRHLRKHKKEMLDDPSVTVYKCVACPKMFVDKEFYQKHRNVHDPECWDKFKCTPCNRSFRDRVRLKEHQQSIHEGVKPHQCDVCGRTFHRMSNMRVHRARHFGHKCPHCEEIFERLRPLANHVQDIHGMEPDFRLQQRKTHTGGCYVCRFCGKQLASNQSLLDHEHIHTGEKPYSCNACDKTFRSYTAKWAHLQRHEKGNYVCEHCGKCFSYKQNLTTHMQIHVPMEDRKHQCSKCGKRFLRKAHLNVHMRIHDGVRPYACDICHFSFTQLGDMRRHRARHANGDVRMRRPRTKSVPSSSNEESI